MIGFLFRRTFRRMFRGSRAGAPRRRARFVEELLDTCRAAGLDVALAGPDAVEHRAGRAADGRGHGLIEVRNGPPDWINVTSDDPGSGHLVTARATGFHFLSRRPDLARDWPAGRLEAKREFSPRALGPARAFRWTPADDSAVTRAVADHLQQQPALSDAILTLLQDPGALTIEVVAEPELDLIRASLYLGNRQLLEVSEVEMLRDLCRAIAAAAPQNAERDDA